MRFKDVLDLAKKKAGHRPRRSRSAPPSCRDRRSTTWSSSSPRTTRRAPHDAFEFLAQIGGKQYSRKVLRQLADTVFDQTRYERAVEAYRLLIELDPNDADAPDYHGGSSSRTSCSAT